MFNAAQLFNAMLQNAFRGTTMAGFSGDLNASGVAATAPDAAADAATDDEAKALLLANAPIASA